MTDLEFRCGRDLQGCGFQTSVDTVSVPESPCRGIEPLGWGD